MLWRLMLVVVSLAFVSACQAQAPVAPYESGTQYFPIDPPVPTSAPPGKVEVVEVFSYACIHCAHFQPLVDAWRAKQSKNVVFKYLPAAWNEQWEGFAKAFLAADALGVVEQTHAAMFKALHEEKKNFASLDDLAQWYAGFGVKPEAFKSAYGSMTTLAGLEHSKTVVPQYGIDGTPTVIVAGKYRVTGQSAGAAEKVFDVVDFLVAKELAAGGRK
jgi:thiol:disulfide interchange protein DsbA